MKFFNKVVKRLDGLDIGLIKFSVVAFTFVVLKVWTGLMSWMNSIDVWWFVAAFVILVARPVYRGYFRKKRR